MTGYSIRSDLKAGLLLDGALTNRGVNQSGESYCVRGKSEGTAKCGFHNHSQASAFGREQYGAGLYVVYLG